MPEMETRFFCANVRAEGAAGIFEDKVFELSVPVTGSHHKLMDTAIAAIREKGFETNFIRGHSYNRNFV